jgi:glycosyltransferase involved in cell wall biosynthesis
MDGKARVSVVVSILNAERFLAETVESVSAQTFKNWELLLVDDAVGLPGVPAKVLM